MFQCIVHLFISDSNYSIININNKYKYCEMLKNRLGTDLSTCASYPLPCLKETDVCSASK